MIFLIRFCYRIIESIQKNQKNEGGFKSNAKNQKGIKNHMKSKINR